MGHRVGRGFSKSPPWLMDANATCNGDETRSHPVMTTRARRDPMNGTV